MTKLKIKLGKGLVLEAPINLNMDVEEWKRMTQYINSLLNIKR